jgi:hypothetical protein
MAFEDELLDIAKEDIANKYAKQKQERDRQIRQNHSGLSGSSLTSAINPFNLARQREFLTALAASRDMRRQDEDLALRRSGQEHQQRLAENTLAEQKRQAQAKEEQARQTFGLNRDILENTKLNQAHQRNLDMKQIILKHELDNKRISLDAFAAGAHVGLQALGVNITQKELKRRLEEEPYLRNLSLMQMANEIEHTGSARVLQGRNVGVSERDAQRQEQAQRYSQGMYPETQEGEFLKDQAARAASRRETAESRANYEKEQEMQYIQARMNAIDQEKAQLQAMANNISGVGNVMHMGKDMERTASTATPQATTEAKK